MAPGIPGARRLEEGCVWSGRVSRLYFGEAYARLTQDNTGIILSNQNYVAEIKQL